MNDCKHEACHCSGEEIGTDGYCSPSCREQKMDGENCACGHSACQ